MLVRARFKSVQELADINRCCDDARRLYAEQPPMVVDLSDQQDYEWSCGYCGAGPHTTRVVRIVGGKWDGKVFDFASLDLDEGPLEAA